jgi:hypothetical protein
MPTLSSPCEGLASSHDQRKENALRFGGDERQGALEQRPDFNLIKQAVAICDRIDKTCAAMLTSLGAPPKPELDLSSWAALGRDAIPPRQYVKRRRA